MVDSTHGFTSGVELQLCSPVFVWIRMYLGENKNKRVLSSLEILIATY